MPYSDYSYLDPLHIVWRKGTEDDPYIDRVEYLKVVNQKIVLSEIPDRTERVKIAGLREINYDGLPKKSIAPDEFSVNYSTGVIQVHASQENKTLNVRYKGRGFIQYPSSRIYHQDEMNNVVESLESIINRTKKNVEIIETRITDYEEVRNRMLDTINEANQAISNANKATENAEVATDKALDAYETTRLVFKPYVINYEDIAITYPNPEIGWTTQVYETGIRYRWDGIEWVPIDIFGGSIPLADESQDGLMSKEDYIKLQKIDEVTTARRVLVFVLPSYIFEGKQGIIARFPFNGKIIGVKAICGVQGETDTHIAIEKSRDMVSWKNILSSNIVIGSYSYFDNGTATISDDEVFEGDLFRLDVVQQGLSIQNITVEIIIETN